MFYKVDFLAVDKGIALISQVLLDDGNRIIIPQGNFNVLPFDSFSGRNSGYRHTLPRFEDWEKNHCYKSSDSSDSDDKDKGEWVSQD